MVVILNRNVLVEDQKKVKCGACTFDILKDGEVQGFKPWSWFQVALFRRLSYT